MDEMSVRKRSETRKLGKTKSPWLVLFGENFWLSPFFPVPQLKKLDAWSRKKEHQWAVPEAVLVAGGSEHEPVARPVHRGGVRIRQRPTAERREHLTTFRARNIVVN